MVYISRLFKLDREFLPFSFLNVRKWKEKIAKDIKRERKIIYWNPTKSIPSSQICSRGVNAASGKFFVRHRRSIRLNTIFIHFVNDFLAIFNSRIFVHTGRIRFCGIRSGSSGRGTCRWRFRWRILRSHRIHVRLRFICTWFGNTCVAYGYTHSSVMSVLEGSNLFLRQCKKFVSKLAQLFIITNISLHVDSNFHSNVKRNNTEAYC